MLQISSHVQSNNILLDVFKVCKLQKRAEQFMELFNVFEIKILSYYLEFSFLPENFFFLLLYLPSFVWAPATASQAKLFRFFLQHLHYAPPTFNHA